VKIMRRYTASMAAIVTATTALLVGTGALAGAANADSAFVNPSQTVTTLASTIPATNGDLNPYGVAVVPTSTGDLQKGDVLVSNFNDSANVQGTGTTIMQVTPGGTASVFAQISGNLPGACPGGVGLTTALTVLRSGWVIVGSLPTTDGAPVNAGCLLVLDSHGVVRETFSGHGLNGPWDMTSLDLGSAAVLFVTNVLNGTVNGGGNVVNGGTVLRLLVTIPPFGLPKLQQVTPIGSGFEERTDPAALVIGPTGLGLGSNGTLYVADSLQNRIAAIPNALLRISDDGTGQTVTENDNLQGELGLAIAPNGDILTVNAGNGNIVETTPGGDQIAVVTLDNTPTPGAENGSGSLFGLAVKPGADAVYFVDDDFNTLNLLS
jgi:hypothetical protein